MDNLHVIHSRGGCIGGDADTGPADVDAIITALANDPRRHLVLHFHGGLVSKSSGLKIAARLKDEYAPAPGVGAYPVFYVWESGFWETIRNNLTELADEPVFKQVLRKLVQYALERLGGQELPELGSGRSVLPAAIGSREAEVRQAFAAFWAAPGKETLPLRGLEPLASPTAARSADAQVDDDEIQADLESDTEFLRALATLPDLTTASRSALAPAGVADHRSRFAEMAADHFCTPGTTRGLLELARVARFLARVLRAVVRRRAAQRDHGLYATCVEEALRAFKVAGSGVHQWGQALEWNRMKQDTLDAFGGDPQVHAGTALLARLRDALNGGLSLDRITLVGHSTGAIYIAHWLAHARDFLPPELKQDVVFLAPAITHELFARTLAEHGSRIGHFRLFGMKDAVERDDQVWGDDPALEQFQDWRRWIYPSSLLYLVSGVLETVTAADGTVVDEADVPLLGMERFLANVSTYCAANGAAFGAVDTVRTWLQHRPGATVWSVTGPNAPAGQRCDSIDHGAFDEDRSTLDSLRHILRQGF